MGQAFICIESPRTIHTIHYKICNIIVQVLIQTENNYYFVEFIKAERLDDDEEAEGLWFIELFEKGVIGQWYINLTDNEIKHKTGTSLFVGLW